MPDLSSDNYHDNLLTPELVGWLAAGERAMIGEYLYPYVHRAVMRFRIRRHLSGDDGDDLESDAFLFVLQRLQKMFDTGGLEQFSSHLVFLMVRDCYIEKQRGRESREKAHLHYDAVGSEVLESRVAYSGSRQTAHERQIQAREALRAAIAQLSPEDRETLTLFENHYFLCEEELDPGSDLNDPDTIKSVRASALKHLALSLHVNMSTVYRRLNRAGERLRELLDDWSERETPN